MANGQPAWLKLSTQILGHKTTDLTHSKLLCRFSYILRRSIKFLFRNCEKKWQLPAQIQHFFCKYCFKRLFCLYHISKLETLLTWKTILAGWNTNEHHYFGFLNRHFQIRNEILDLGNCYENSCLCVTSYFVNSSLIFQSIHLLSSSKDSSEFQLQNPLSQNSSAWSISQDLSLLSHLPRTEGLFYLCVTDQYFTHKIQTGKRLRLKLSSIIEFVYLHIC